MYLYISLQKLILKGFESCISLCLNSIRSKAIVKIANKIIRLLYQLYSIQFFYRDGEFELCASGDYKH